MEKKIEVFENWDMQDEIIVVGKCTAEEAYEYAKKDYPETMKIYTISEVHPVVLHKCLDCGSQWIDEDGWCGECGEQRLSKREIKGYYIY